MRYELNDHKWAVIKPMLPKATRRAACERWCVFLESLGPAVKCALA